MHYISQVWKSTLSEVLSQVLAQEILPSQVVLNIPPSLAKGDIAFPMFPYQSKTELPLNQFSQKVAHALTSRISADNQSHRVVQDGAYINIFLDRGKTTSHIVHTILSCDMHNTPYGSSELLRNQRIMIEFSAPNTNKPLHLGHLRNIVLGESMSRIFRYLGAEVRQVNLVNDRGIHICKSMLAYKEFGMSETPESTGMKSDYFVGKYYVRYSQWEQEWIEEHGKDSLENKDSPHAQAYKMLQDWEKGDESVRALWKRMNTWVLEGMDSTYETLNIHFDTTYYESENYMLGKDIILSGLEDNIFFKNEQGAVCVSLESINSDNKVLLRSDGTSVYVTQDLGTAYKRYEDWKYSNMVYVVGNEQNYYFTTLFYILEQLGFEPAINKNMMHMGYGMVHLPEGRMKSREGTVVDADDLIETVVSLVRQEIEKRDRIDKVDDIDRVTQSITLGAIFFYLLNTNPKKDIIFDIESSIQFLGKTGPYIQYTYARIYSILQKYGDTSGIEARIDGATVTSDEEWNVILALDQFPSILEQVVEKYDPSILSGYLYKLSSYFASLYQNTPIATESNRKVRDTRIAISKAVLLVLQQGLSLINIPYLTSM